MVRSVAAVDRFIPTRVGSCRHGDEDDPNMSVHPHSRGELRVKGRRAVGAPGSSPLAWGVGLMCRIPVPEPRFIPTRVGSCFCE